MILSDFDLRNYIKAGRLVIKPFSKEIVRENGIDFRLGNEIARLKAKSKVLDVRRSGVTDYYTVEKPYMGKYQWQCGVPLPIPDKENRLKKHR